MGYIRLKGENYHFMIKAGDCYCIHLFSIDKNLEMELKDLDTKIITKDRLSNIIDIKDHSHLLLNDIAYKYEIKNATPFV